MAADQSAEQRSLPSNLRRGAAAIVVLLLLWFVGVQGFAALSARSGNAAALPLFDPGNHPAAGVRLAQLYLAAEQPDRAIAPARAAALGDPMNVRAVRTLGLALETRDVVASRNLMRAAEGLSWRDTQTSLWVMRDAALHADVSRVMNQIDALARRQVEPDVTARLFYASLTDAPSRRAFATLLGQNPPWRGGFFADARTRLPRQSHAQMEALLGLLGRTPAPPTAAERMTFIDRLVDSGDGERARGYWARTFGIAADAVKQQPFDPAFRSVATRPAGRVVSPFEWKVGADADQFISFRDDDGGRVLDINPGGDRVSLLTQVLLLTPGSHRIDATVVQGSPQNAPAGWQVTCAPSGTPLIRSFATQGNELSGVTVSVPPEGCKLQTLMLVGVDRINAQPISIRSVSIRPAGARSPEQ